MSVVTARAHRTTWLIALVCILGFLGAACVAFFAFERLPHLEDEVAYLFQAKTLALGRLTVPSPAQPDSFWTPFVLDDHGLRFGKYPPGWPAMLALGALAKLPWLVNPLLAALLLYLVYRLGATLYDKPTGVLAAALGAVSPLYLVLGGSLLSHLATSVWLLLFSLWFIETARGRGARYAVAAGAALGLAFLTRSLTAVAYAAPFALFALVRLSRRRDPLARYLPMLAAAGACAALLPLYQWAVTGDPWLNPYTLWWPYDRIGFGPGIGAMPGGHSWHYAWINLKQDLMNAATDVLGWPWLSWLPLLLGLLLPVRRGRDRWLVAPFLCLVIAYLFYWVGSPMRLWGPRYYFEGFAPLWLLGAVGLRKAWELPVMLGSPSRMRYAFRQVIPDCHPERVNRSKSVKAESQRRISSWEFLGNGSTSQSALRRVISEASRLCARLFPKGCFAIAGVALSSSLSRQPVQSDNRASVGWRRALLAGAVIALTAANLAFVLPPRLRAAHGLYGITRAQLRPIEQANLHHALVIVYADRWLEYGAMLGQMSPLLDDDIVYARGSGPETDAAVIAAYPGRIVMYLKNGQVSPTAP